VLRFIPDTWADALLRPLLLADPAVGLYSEIHAPDWRFTALLLFLAIAAAGLWGRRVWNMGRDRSEAPNAAPRPLPMLNAAQWRMLVGFALCFYLWTFISGNGRYFTWALLILGPLVVVASRRLPGTQAMRNFALILALAVQGVAAWMTFEVNTWGLRPWRSGPGLVLAKTPLRERPAVFLTIGSISYSILVPHMHPLSRWSNITGQQDLVPGMPEYEQLQALLRSPLPKYVLFNASRLARAQDDRPLAEASDAMKRVMDQQNLRPLAEDCEFVSASIAGLPYSIRTSRPVDDGFWFCPVEPKAGTAVDTPARKPVAPELDDVFERIEQHCPRYFPSGTAHTRLGADGAYARHYSYSDTSVYVNPAGDVYFKYFRALNPSVIGEVQTLRQGRFSLDCSRLPGRYAAPWDRD
jgi:hypothetical protein